MKRNGINWITFDMSFRDLKVKYYVQSENRCEAHFISSYIEDAKIY